MAMGWFGAALLATLAYGFMQTVQKLAAARALAPLQLVFAGALTASLLALAGTTVTGGWDQVSARTLLHAVLNSLFFTSGSVLLLLALEQASAAVALPVNKLDSVLVVGIGALAFGERPSAAQWLGVLLGLAVVAVLTWPSGGARRLSRAQLMPVLVAAGAAACFAGSMTVGRLAARSDPMLAYVAITYGITAVLALGASRLFGRGCGRPRDALRFGAAIGVLNFAGYLLILYAFARGPMALIQPIFASSMLVAVVLSSRILRERLVLRHGVAMALSIGAAVLIKLGAG